MLINRVKYFTLFLPTTWPLFYRYAPILGLTRFFYDVLNINLRFTPLLSTNYPSYPYLNSPPPPPHTNASGLRRRKVFLIRTQPLQSSCNPLFGFIWSVWRCYASAIIMDSAHDNTPLHWRNMLSNHTKTWWSSDFRSLPANSHTKAIWTAHLHPETWTMAYHHNNTTIFYLFMLSWATWDHLWQGRKTNSLQFSFLFSLIFIFVSTGLYYYYMMFECGDPV